MDFNSGKGRKSGREKEEEGMSELQKKNRRKEWRERRKGGSKERKIS